MHPLRGAVVAASHASEVVTPAYDALTRADRQRIAAEHPDSFLTALPADSVTVDTDDFATCRAAAERLLATGRFRHHPTPFVALYRLRVGAHVQTALLCDLESTAVDDALIVGHEHTRAEREDHLVEYLRQVRITSSPVCVMHATGHDLAAVIERACAQAPDISVEEPDLGQQVWIVDDQPTITGLLTAAAEVGPLVITDGHHRTAAARRFADEASHAAGRRLLVAMFPDDGVQIREFNRAITPVGAPRDELTAAIARLGFEVESLPGPEHPQAPGHLTMTAQGSWWRLRVPDDRLPDDPIARLDVSLLHDLLLGPLLDVTDPRTDPRLRFVPGVLGLDRLAAEAAGGVGFALHPVAADDVRRIAMSGRTLPPKSTYLYPKARSGLLLLPRH